MDCKTLKYSHLDLLVTTFFVAISFLVLPWDLEIVRLINKLHTPLLNIFFYYFTEYGNYLFALGIALPIIIVRDRDFLKRWIPLVLITYGSWFISDMTVRILKNIFRRHRPYVYDANLEVIAKAGGYSFPSGHAESGWALATPLLLFTKNRWLKVLLVIFALLMAFSRVYCAVHYLTDVIWGSLIGYYFSSTIYCVYSYKTKKG